MAYCARVSSPDQEKAEYAQLFKYCLKNSHFSVFEMANMCVEINTSRGISPQILRHWVFSFQEFSQRYSAVTDSSMVLYEARRQDKKNRQNSIDDLSPEIKQEWRDRLLENWNHAFAHYDWALKNDIAKEQARFFLPLNTATRLYMSGTVRDWIHYINLRTGNGTQKEHSMVAEAIKTIMAEQFPTIAQALDWK